MTKDYGNGYLVHIVHFTSSVYEPRIDILNSNLDHTKLTKHFGAFTGEVKLGSQFL